MVEAAHRLPSLPDQHKCSRLHGHTFVIEVHLQGDNDNNNGWVMDFADISKIFRPIFERIDHRYLNEIPGLENPTSENLCIWIWNKLEKDLQLLYKIVVSEDHGTGIVYNGTSDSTYNKLLNQLKDNNIQINKLSKYLDVLENNE